MADAMISPAVGGTMWAVSAATVAYSSGKIRSGLYERNVPLMGVLGAFLFAAQMINFTIPGTGSSGHLGGGLLLAILLGPHGAFLAIASVLTVQALFFADGGLLALGCNMFNLGFIPSFFAYPLIYKNLSGTGQGRVRTAAGIVCAAIISLQLGSFAVVLETVLSGISDLPFLPFVMLMQPIHLAIGIVEGSVTLAVVSFISKARPEILVGNSSEGSSIQFLRKPAIAFLTLALITGGFLSWFASKNPDGLEWSIAGLTGTEELQRRESGLHAKLSQIQEKTSFFPDYSLKKPAASPKGNQPKATGDDNGETGIAGVIGTVITLALTFLIAFFMRRKRG